MSALRMLAIATIATGIVVAGDRASSRSASAGAARAESSALVAARARADRQPTSVAAQAALAQAALADQRATSDPAFYVLAERAAKRALELDGENAEALGANAALAVSRHRFTLARAYALRSAAAAPERLAPLDARPTPRSNWVGTESGSGSSFADSRRSRKSDPTRAPRMSRSSGATGAGRSRS